MNSFFVKTLDCRFGERKYYLILAIFIVANMFIPQLFHIIPNGGRMFLPIFFLTFLVSYKFGNRLGIIFSVLTPIANYLVVGMPNLGMLPIVLFKSFVIAICIALFRSKTNKISLLNILLVVLLYQTLGFIFEWVLFGNLNVIISSFLISIPGVFLQIFGVFYLLKSIAKYE